MTEAVPSAPHMEAEGLACFQAQLATSRCYLEYGSGASTVYANNVAKVPHTISVESDRKWAESVAGSLDRNGARTLISFCDIGEVGNWGTPTGRQRMDAFWRYATSPWEAARQRNLVPDTVLIDGRFRVASFLYSLLCARTGTVILFDDYRDRAEYFVVEKFCPVDAMYGRMALFRADRAYSVPDIAAAFAQYSVIPA